MDVENANREREVESKVVFIKFGPGSVGEGKTLRMGER